MDNLEKIEKIRERANVTYQEAKEALEESDWDMLDALLKLEAQGKVKDPARPRDTTTNPDPAQQSPAQPAQSEHERAGSGESSSQGKKEGGFFAQLGRFLNYLVKKGCRNRLITKRHGEQLMELPVLAFIVLLLLGFWVIIPLMIISLFFDFSYRFKGPELGRQSVNDAMDKASKMADDIKSDVKSNMDQDKK